ncbi:MAG: PAS domain-containing protein [Mycobacteriales bacterium]
MADRADVSPQTSPDNFDALVLTNVLDEVNVGVAVLDSDGLVTHWNHEAERMLGYPAAEAVGRAGIELGAALVDRAEATRIQSGVLAGQTWTGEFPLVDRTGRRFLAYLNAAPVLARDQSVAGIFALFYEADLHRVDEALASLFDRVFHDAPMGIVIFDTEYRLVRLNPTAQERLGPPSAMLGRDLHSVFSGGVETLAGHLADVLATGESRAGLELWLIGPDAEPQCWLSSLVRLQRDDEVLGVAVLFTDVTAERLSRASHQRQAAHLAMLRDAALLVTVQPEPEAALTGLLRATVPGLATRVELHLLDAGGGSRRQPVRIATADPAGVTVAAPGEPGPPADTDHPAWSVARHGAAHQENGVMAVPVPLFGVVYAVLTLSRAGGMPFDTEDLAAAEAMTGYLVPVLVHYFGRGR